MVHKKSYASKSALVVLKDNLNPKTTASTMSEPERKPSPSPLTPPTTPPPSAHPPSAHPPSPPPPPPRSTPPQQPSPTPPPSHEAPAPPSQPPSDNRITLNVRDENGNQYAFMMKQTTAFKRIFDAFSQKVGVRVRTFRFHYEGLRLAEEDTPERIGLHDDDLIEAFVLAEGG